jgi:hypothetical protein
MMMAMATFAGRWAAAVLDSRTALLRSNGLTASSPNFRTPGFGRERPVARWKSLVAHIFVAREQGRQHELRIADQHGEFGLPVEDAELAIDRVCEE